MHVEHGIFVGPKTKAARKTGYLVTEEERQRRMDAFLARVPRNPKTRALIGSLAGDAHQAAEAAKAREAERRQAIAAYRKQKAERDAERYAAWEARGKVPAQVDLGPVVGRKRPGARRKRKSWAEGEYFQTRRTLWAAQSGICPICGDCVGQPSEHPTMDDCNIDHVVPHWANGPDAIGNFLLVHKPCNEGKGGRFPTGCEMIWLLATNARIGALPVVY